VKPLDIAIRPRNKAIDACGDVSGTLDIQLFFSNAAYHGMGDQSSYEI
jgi:hypothetical protein